MAISFDGPNKQINLSTGTVTMSVPGLWSRWVDWFLTGDNSKYGIWFLQLGGNDIDPVAGTKVPIYIFQDAAVAIKPQEANHTLTVTDGVLVLIDGGDPFMDTIGAYTARINYQQPVQVIGYSYNTGSGMSSEQDAKLTSINARTELQDKVLKNRRRLIKEAGVWYLEVYDDNNTTLLIKKVLKDLNVSDIDDLAAGDLCMEMPSSV